MKPILTRIALEFCVLAMFATTATGQFAPSSLAVPSAVSWSGTFLDSEEGLLSETKTVNITSPTNFVGSNSYGDSSTGTYTYTNTGSNTGRINYTATYTYDDGEGGQDTETEVGIVNLTFTSATGGTITSSGTWATSNGFNGTFTNGSGDFTYQLPDPDDLVGTWTTPTEDGGIAYITFLDDGTHHHTEDGIADGIGFPGMEIGTYTWNTTTGAFASFPNVDQNGE